MLVTGGTGFLGRTLVPLLIRNGYHVRMLVRKSSRIDIFDRPGNLSLFYGDLVDPKSLIGIEKDIDYVCHLAVLGHLHTDRSLDDFLAVNLTGSLNLLERFKGSRVRKILFTSTTAALGLMKKRIITEEDFAMPATAYGLSKYQAEKALAAFCEKNRLPFVIARLSHVYGPVEKRDLYRMIKMIKKGYFPQVGFSPNLYPAVYIEDAAEGVRLAMERGRDGQTYTITDHESHDTRTIRQIVRECLDIHLKIYPFAPRFLTFLIFYVSDSMGRLTGRSFPVTLKNIRYITSGRVFSIEKAKQELGYDPKISLKQGLTKTIEHLRKEHLL